MKEILIVGFGGFTGSVLRYFIARMMLPLVVSTQFPYPTLIVNVVGSLLIGVMFSSGVSGGWYLLGVTGFCGGFTTFSAFSLEVVGLLRSGNYTLAALYVVLSLVLSVAAAGVGFYMMGVKFKTAS